MEVNWTGSKTSTIKVDTVTEPNPTKDGKLKYWQLNSDTQPEIIFTMPHEVVKSGDVIQVSDGIIAGKHYVFSDAARNYLTPPVSAPVAQGERSERTAKVKVVKILPSMKQDGTRNVYSHPQYGDTFQFDMEVEENGQIIKGKIGVKKDVAPFNQGQETDMVIIKNEKGYINFKKVPSAGGGFGGGGGNPKSAIVGNIYAAAITSGKTKSEAREWCEDAFKTAGL